MTNYSILSRVRGRKTWHRHLPGYNGQASAEQRASEFAAKNPAREYKVEPYESLPAPTLPNGQRRHIRRPRRRSA